MSLPSPQPDSVRPTQVRYLVLALLCLMAVIGYVQRGCISILAGDIGLALNIDERWLGVIMGIFFWSYAVLQVPSVWLAERWGLRTALLFFAICSSLPLGLTAFWPTTLGLLICRLGMGFGQAGLFPCSTLAIARWFPARQRGFASGMMGAAMSVGGAVGAWSTSWFHRDLTFEQIFLAYMFPGLLWGGIFYLWFRSSPFEHAWVNSAERALLPTESSPVRERLVTPWRVILNHPALWCICGQQFCRAAGFNYYMTWFPTYLRKVFHIAPEQLGWLSSLPLWGVVCANLLGGRLSDWLIDRTKSRKLGRQYFSAVMQILSAGVLLSVLGISDGKTAAWVIALGALVTSLAAPAAYAITIDMGGKHVGTIFSIMNMCGNFGAMLFPLVVGPLAKANMWNTVSILFAVLYIVAGLCWLPFDADGSIVPETKAESA